MTETALARTNPKRRELLLDWSQAWMSHIMLAIYIPRRIVYVIGLTNNASGAYLEYSNIIPAVCIIRVSLSILTIGLMGQSKSGSGRSAAACLNIVKLLPLSSRLIIIPPGRP